MHWYNYVACFFSGLFLANLVPHFVQGTSGERFPTPFSKPRGRGLSSPTVNVIWALVNLLAGYVLFQAGKIWTEGGWALVVFFLGIVVISTGSSIGFAKKQSK